MNEEGLPNQSMPKGFARKEKAILLTTVFIIAICGILYELLLSTLSSYLLGNSILHFSVTIGLFMSFMGVGSYLSKFFNENILDKFLWIEILLGLIGGLSALILYFSFAITDNYYLISFSLIAILGTLIGLEIPLLTRLVNDYTTLKDAVADVLSFDYIGALLASVIFPLFLLPYFGTLKTSFIVGLLNLSVAFINLSVFKEKLKHFQNLFWFNFLSTVILVLGFLYATQIQTLFESFTYQDEMIFSEQTAYQRIVVTRYNADVRLFLNGNLQFSSIDEYRYHESLVHPPMLAAGRRDRVLILGGGDGLAIREILKYPDVQEIVLVDLDPGMTNLGKNNLIFRKLNQDAFHSPKVKFLNEDAFNFVAKNQNPFQVIIIDLPDPNDTGLGKLYSKEFYSLIRRNLSKDGVFVTQSTSPYFARESFWCIDTTIKTSFTNTLPYNAYIPTFGNWGFIMSWNTNIQTDSAKNKIFNKLQNQTNFQFLKPNVWNQLTIFDPDQSKIPVEINTVESQNLVHYYENSWKYWHN